MYPTEFYPVCENLKVISDLLISRLLNLISVESSTLGRASTPFSGVEAPASLLPSSGQSRLRGHLLGHPVLKGDERRKKVFVREHTFLSTGQHPTEGSDRARARNDPIEIDRPTEVRLDGVRGRDNQVVVQIVVSRVHQK